MTVFSPKDSIEWIETNGLGGYAFGTASGVPTRRYHGWLIAARKPPVDRRLLIGGLAASFISGTRQVPLDPTPGLPRGRATRFERHPFPKTTYRVGPHELVRVLFMRHGFNMTVVRYRLNADSRPVRLSLRLLPLMRDHHDIGAARLENVREIHADILGRNLLRIASDEDTAYVYHSHGKFVPDPAALGPFLYPWETRQGMEDTEWIYSPGRIETEISPGETLDVILSDRPPRAAALRVDGWQVEEETRRWKIAGRVPKGVKDRDLLMSLHLAADQFLVERTPGKRRTIVAGYPWFTDWGRDTMISLEGLTLVQRDWKAARDILAAFAGAESMGMIPNHYPDADEEPRYNTVDASLWFFEAGWKYARASGDFAFVRKTLYPVFRSILRHHLAGTRFNIRADTETGFLFSGEEGTQLTWMDAKVDDWVVTPRGGFPVEIQALWYNALTIFSELADRFGRRDEIVGQARRVAQACKKNFLPKFWNDEGGYLHDCISPAGVPAPDLRPNQLIAMSLTHPILEDRRRAGRILAVIRKKLLTPRGLRTLSPDHPDYKGRHEGDRRTRDAAYHQGTVWPWLLGPYARAALRAEGNTVRTRRHLARVLKGFEKHLTECAVGTVSEIFDGDGEAPPHAPKGCVAQAWSVAELVVIGNLLASR